MAQEKGDININKICIVLFLIIIINLIFNKNRHIQQEKDEINLQHLVIPESKEAVKDCLVGSQKDSSANWKIAQFE